MQSLSSLLLAYKIPGVRHSEIRRICAEEIAALIGISVASTQVQFKNDQLLLAVPPIVKSALFMRQGELIANLSARSVDVIGFR